MKKSFLIPICAAIVLTACKPTEKNYQSAYDKAHEAAERKRQEMNSSSIEGTVLESLDGPRIEIIEGDTVYLSRKRVSVLDKEVKPDGKLGLAVARYSMPTNARHHASEIQKQYPRTFITKDGDDNYYVVVETLLNLPEAPARIREFKVANPDYYYVGLEGHPIILNIIQN